MRTMFIRGAVAVLAGGATAAGAFAQIVNFEYLPQGGTPTDGQSISDQYELSHGVKFSLENGGFPVIAKVGAPRTAFQGYNLLPDQPAPGVDAGTYFLTDDGVLAGPPDALIVTYTNPVFAAGGILLDIDGQEEFTVEARDQNGAVLENRVLPPNNQLDGSGTGWSFSRAQADIYSIRIRYTGNQANSVGLAFDTFFVSSVPEPTALTAIGLGTLLFAGRKKRC